MARALNAAWRELREIVELLRSRAVVVALIAVLGALYATGLLVPQQRQMDPRTYEAWRRERPRLVAALDRIGATDVYRAPVTVGVTALFFLSLGAVLVERIPRTVRRTRLDQGLPLDVSALARRKGTRAVPAVDPGAALARAAASLEADGYVVYRSCPLAARAVRFRWAPLGFLLFHGSFAVLAAAGIMLDLTRFSVTVRLAEGESFDAASGPYTERPRRPRLGPDHPAVAFRVLEIRPQRRGPSPVRLEADLLAAGESEPRTVEVNHPVQLGGASILVMDVGPAPLFTCTRPGGASDGAYVKLASAGDGGTRFRLDDCGLDVLVRPVRPPVQAQGGGVMLQAGVGHAGSEDLPDGVEVALRGPSGDVTRGVLQVGGRLTASDGRMLEFPELRRFSDFQVISERGGALLAAGFALAIAGLVMRLALFRREVAVVADPASGRLLLAAASDAPGLGTAEAALDRGARAAAGASAAGAHGISSMGGAGDVEG